VFERIVFCHASNINGICHCINHPFNQYHTLSKSFSYAAVVVPVILAQPSLAIVCDPKSHVIVMGLDIHIACICKSERPVNGSNRDCVIFVIGFEPIFKLVKAGNQLNTQTGSVVSKLLYKFNHCRLFNQLNIQLGSVVNRLS
jgi:hypothetical protein